MALSYAMHTIEDGTAANLTNYGEFLAKFPPKWEAKSPKTPPGAASTASSAGAPTAAATEASPAGTRSGAPPCAKPSTTSATPPLHSPNTSPQPLFKDLWAARDAYIQVVLDRSPASIIQASSPTTPHVPSAKIERITALELMELERHTQLMYTSCGWFFDEISGIETVQIIAYAGRVLQLAPSSSASPAPPSKPNFSTILAKAKSNVPEMGDGAEVYRRYVNGMRSASNRSAPTTPSAPSSAPTPNTASSSASTSTARARRSSTPAAAASPSAAPSSTPASPKRTKTSASPSSTSATRTSPPPSSAYNAANPEEVEAFAHFSTEIGAAIRRANLPEVIRLIDRFFGETAYSLTSLFADEQHRILNTILNQTLSEMEESLRKIYEDHASLLHFLTESGMTAPPALASAAQLRHQRKPPPRHRVGSLRPRRHRDAPRAAPKPTRSPSTPSSSATPQASA